MAVRHLGELKKKKSYGARDSRIHLRCLRTFLASPRGLDTGKPTPSGCEVPGGRAATASQSPRRGRRAVPGARGGPATRGPAPQPGPSGPRFQPGTYKANPRASRGPRGGGEKREKAPHPRTGARPLPQPHPDKHRERRRARPPPPPPSAAPARGRPRASASPPARQPHPRRPPPRTPGRRGPARVRPRAAALPRPAGRPRSGPGAPVPSGPHRNALEDAPGRGCPDVFGVAVADNGGLLAAAIAHQVIHVALPTGHLRALRTAAGTARSSRRSGGGGGRGRRRRGGRRGGGGEEAALRKHRPPPSPRSCGGRTRGRR